MTFEQVVNKIKSDTWWSEETPCNFQQSIAPWRAFIYQGKTYGPDALSICIALYRNDFLFEKTSRTEKLAQFKKAIQDFGKNPSKILWDYKEFLKTKSKLVPAGEALLAAFKSDNPTLARRYIEFYDLYTQCFTHSVMPEAADVYSDEELSGDAEANVVLSTYPMLSFMEQERVDFLTMILSGKPDFRKFSEKYFWVQNNYLGSKFLDEKYFRRVYIELSHQKNKLELAKELKSLQSKPKRLAKQQKQLLKQFKFSREEKTAFELLRMASRWIDERKWAALHAIYYLAETLKEASKRTKLPEELLGYATPEELAGLLQGQKIISAQKLTDRRKTSVYIYANVAGRCKEVIYTGNKAKEVFRLFTQKTSKMFPGQVASAPVVSFKGKVQVLFNPHTEKFIAGRILVTTMTRPDFVPLMRQASAIITDEGGITSHAAIVSRELGIPCIIGTKIATKAFKTGDVAEIDLVKGMVRKI